MEIRFTLLPESQYQKILFVDGKSNEISLEFIKVTEFPLQKHFNDEIQKFVSKF